MTLPLEDVRVVAIEQFGAGPWATMQLADLGADVIKIEDPRSGGDVGRSVPPYRTGEDSLFFEAFNRGKRSLSLDLRVPGARGVLEALVARSDALLANLRGDSFVRLGLRHEDLAHVNPRLVCCSLSGYGLTGPRAGEGAYDHVVQARAGWMSVTGEPDGPPLRSGVSLADFSAGYAVALAILAGLWQARRTGIGCDCDLSLFELSLAQLNYLATWTLSAAFVPQRLSGSAHQTVVPFQTFPTQDGWIVIAAPKAALWRRMTEALELPQLADDPRFADFAARLEHRDELVELLSRRLRRAPTEAWLERLEDAGVPCAPVNDVAAAFADPQAVARSVVQEVEHPVLGVVRHVASPLRLSTTGGSTPRRAPRRGEHTAQLLGELCGYDAGAVEELRHAGVFGDG